MDDFNDLIGDEPKAKRGRPTNEERARRAEQMLADQAHQAEIRRAGSGQSRVSVDDFLKTYVSQNWLHRAGFGDSMTIRKRLSGAPVAGRIGHNREIYRLVDVIPYLIKPVMTAEQFAKTLNKADLPPEINNAFWNAQRARIRYKLEAQEAWDTEDVLRFLGVTGMELKDALVMSVEEMRSRAKLTDEQCAMFEAMLDEMRETIAGRLLALAESGDTESLADQPLFGVSKDITPPSADWLDEDDDA